MPNIFYGFIAFILALALTFPLKRLVWRWKVLDIPGEERKIHKAPTPLLGGVAIFLSFWAVFAIAFFINRDLFVGAVGPKQIFGVFLGSAIIMICGFLDDKYSLRPGAQIWGPVLAATIVLAFGVGVRFITNPFGGVLRLDQFSAGAGLGLWLIFPANLITFFWLLGTMYTTKILDGLDGLVAGIAAIGATLIFLFTTFTKYLQPDVALMAVIFAGAAGGFLIWNFYPAKIFLGEGGSIFAGFMLGVLAVISGGKIAIALLVIGLPALDLVWIICRRIFWEKHSPASADRKHLHFRLLDLGLTPRQAVLCFYLFSIFFGGAALFLPSREKLAALGILIVLMVILSVLTVFWPKKDKSGRK